MNRSLFWTLLLFFGSGATSAAAQTCAAQFELLGQPLRVSYNPFASQQVAQTVQLKVRRITREATSIQFLLVDPTPHAGEPRLGETGPDLYDIAWISDVGRPVFVWGAESLNRTNGATVSFGDQSDGDTAVATFQLRIPRGQSVAAGLQNQDLAVRYQCFSGSERLGGETEQRSASVALMLDVPRYVAAYLGGLGNTRGQISFGPVTGNEGIVRRSVSVTALSTVPYEVTVDSAHLGELRTSQPQSGGMRYTMKYGGAVVDAAAPVTCPMAGGNTGRVENFDVELDTASARQLPAGDYNDTITLTFAPRDGSPLVACTR